MKQNNSSTELSLVGLVDGQVLAQIATEESKAVQFAAYHEMAEAPVTFASVEEEFLTRLAQVEDLQKRFHFMMTELKSAGLKVED